MHREATIGLRTGSFLLSTLFLVSAAQAAPPKVIKATPDNGDRDVDPSIRFIRVEFDQDMAEGSHSWVGGGEKFPKTRSAPFWEGPRVAVLPVELVPEHDYWLSINSDRFQNFRNRKGEPAVSYPIAFRTGSATAKPDKQADKIADNRASITALRRVLEQHYSYFELRKVDWDEAFKEFDQPLERAPRAEDFAKTAGDLLAKAEDIHIWLRCGRLTFPSYHRKKERNIDRRVLRDSLPNWKKESRCIGSAEYPDGIGYINIASWEIKYQQDLKVLPKVLERFKDAPGLIIDVRLNAGGNEMIARQFAGRFIDKPAVYAKHVLRRPDLPGGFSEPFERELHPTSDGPRYRGKVVVLMGRCNMSSCEAFLLMMRQTPNCKLVGETSYGSSGNPQPHELPNGVTVMLPSWKAMTPDGKCFEGVGIKPDIEVNVQLGEFLRHDPVLKAGLKALRE